MNDMNWKTWGLIILIAMGIVFETVKRLPNDETKWTADVLKFPGAATAPYQVKFKKGQQRPPDMLPPMKMPRPQATHVAAHAAVNRETIEKFIAANSTHRGEFNHVGKGAEGKDPKAKVKKKKKDDGEEWEIIVDPRTGKRYRRKKKKVATVEEAKVEVAKEEPKTEEPKKEDDNIDGLMNEAIVSGGLQPVGSRADTPHADLEEWKRRLLAYPNATETRRFIEHYKNGLVTAEIFYKIVALMVEDSRPQMKELGVLCAGLTPSVLSFQVLAEILKSERSGSTLRSYTDSFLNQYALLTNLFVLERLLKSPPSAFVAVQATKKLDAAATNYLAPAKHKPAKSGAAANAGHSNAGYFRRFVAPLQNLAKNPDSQVSEQARVTLANMNKLMEMNSAPETVTPPTTVTAPAQASAQQP